MPDVSPSTIDRVKVYSQGARVYRSLEAKLPEGSDAAYVEVEIKDLPLSLQDASAKLLLSTHRNEWAVSQIRVGLHVATRKEKPESPDESKLRELYLKHELLTHRHRLLLGECELLESMEPPERPPGREGMPPPASPLVARLALEHFVSVATESRVDDARAIAEDLEKLDEEIAEMQDRIARASSAKRVRGEEVSKVILARIERRRGESREVQLELSYMVPGARWVPQYTCRIARLGESAHIQMRALVIQGSGEDWRDVKLELSTADPMSWTELPKLSSLRIGKAQPPEPSVQGYRPAPRGASTLFLDRDDAYTRAQMLAKVRAPQQESFDRFGENVGPHFPDDLLDWEEELAERGVMTAGSVSYGSEGALHALQEGAMAEGDALTRGGSAQQFFADAPAKGIEEVAFGAALASPAPASPAPASPAPKKRRARASSSALAPGGAPGTRLAMGAQHQTKTPSFQNLILPSPEDTRGRGKLRVATREERYIEIVRREEEWELDFSIEQVLSSAHEEALFASRKPSPHGTQHVRTSSGFFDHVYTTQNRVDVPSSHDFHSVPVHGREAECTLRYVAVPREAQHVFRQAAVKNPGAKPMLTGPAEIYVGDEYVLTTTLPTVAPHAKFELGLGVEQAIKCARNTSFREERSGRAVVATAELHHEIRIEIVNNLERAISCEVRERIPHPAAGAEVVVEELEINPAWRAYTQEERARGRHVLEAGRTWALELEPGERADLLAHYVVKIYANNEVSGGNRREK